MVCKLKLEDIVEGVCGETREMSEKLKIFQCIHELYQEIQNLVTKNMTECKQV